MKNVIDSSEVICIFGMSIGVTDKMWWEYIAKWLKAGHKRRLIIFEKRKGKTKRITKQSLFSVEENILNNFRNNSGIDDTTWKEIRERIFIKINSNLFDFKIVKEEIKDS